MPDSSFTAYKKLLLNRLDEIEKDIDILNQKFDLKAQKDQELMIKLTVELSKLRLKNSIQEKFYAILVAGVVTVVINFFMAKGI